MSEDLNEFGTLVPKRLAEALAEENARLKAKVEVQNRRINLRDEDVGKLHCENARLKAENARLRASSFVTAVPCEEYEKLKAENERLRKAGDRMAAAFTEEGYEDDKDINAWNAAKDGKPSA